MTASPPPKAVAHDEDAQLKADAQHQESVLVVRVLRVEEPNCILVKEHGLRLFKGDTVFTLVVSAFRMIPLELNISHMYSVRMRVTDVKLFLMVKPGEMVRTPFITTPLRTANRFQ
jgi:hypothetical protein